MGKRLLVLSAHCVRPLGALKTTVKTNETKLFRFVTWDMYFKDADTNRLTACVKSLARFQPSGCRFFRTWEDGVSG